MPLILNSKSLIKLGALVAALTAICGGVYGTAGAVKPILDSGPPPFPSRSEVQVQVAGLTATIQGIQQQNAVQAREDANRDRLLAATRQQILESLLLSAQNDYRHAPNMSTRTYICSLINQIDQARAVNRLPPIPPC